MAEITIRLVVDPSTGKKNVLISYGSDSDATPLEHEDMHKRMVDKLIEGGALKAADLGKIVISREDDDPRQAVPQEGGAEEQGGRDAVKNKG